MLAFHRFTVSARLNVTFPKPNHIENVMRNSRGMIGKVCGWNAMTDQVTRRIGFSPLRVKEGFRRLRGHKEQIALIAARRR